MNNWKKIELKLQIPKLNDQLFTALFTKYNKERPTDGNIEKLIEKHTTNKVENHKSKTIKGVKKNEYISAESPDLFDMATPKIKDKVNKIHYLIILKTHYIHFKKLLSETI